MALPRSLLTPTLCLVVLAGDTALADDQRDPTAAEFQGEPAYRSGAMPDYSAPLPQWLDEVKAQRQAWEERRRAAKEAIHARRRQSDPWGAAQHEAREQESQRRHDAIIEQFERDRDTFHNPAPWPGPRDQGPPPPQPAAGAPQPTAPDSTALNPDDPGRYPPSGWDNRWYYRGY
jgi:hypothetical protein